MSENLIYIPFEHYRWIGGPATFMQNLQRFLDQQHYAYLPSLKHAVVLFFPNTFPVKKLTELKNQGGHIIQRLDGIYYPSKHAERYEELNRPVKEIYQQYADTVIFQSRYSQAQCFAMFGEREQCQIIINGVDKRIFYPLNPAEKPSSGKTFKFITTGRFRNIDMIEPVVTVLDQLREQLDFELTVIGPITNPELEPFFQRPYLRHIESLPLEQIAEELRHSDIFIYAHLNPPCPNSVVEAISCGLPVVGFESGAMAELCFFSQDLLAPVSQDVFQKYEDFDARKLAEKLMCAVENYTHYRDIALAHSHLYAFEECGRQYLNIFQHYLKKKRRLLPSMQHRFTSGLKQLRRLPARILHRFFKRLVLSPGSLIQRLLLKLPRSQFLTLFSALIQQKVRDSTPEESLKFLFALDDVLYSFEGQEAVRYGKGLHTKHKHTRYHDFFVQRTEPGSRVLDVGCGNGALAYDLATQVADVSVYGIDIKPKNIEIAQQHYAHDHITYICGDACHALSDALQVDVIILSNVLEHLEQRVEFLHTLQERYHPRKFLIRVPLFDRDWRVPLKDELGLDYRLDPTHCIEYRQDEFLQELKHAGLSITYQQVNWGEIWAETRGDTP